MSVEYKPKGYHTVTPFIYNTNIAETIDFTIAAFGATLKEKHFTPEGRIMHAEIFIGDSIIMMGDQHGDMPPMPTMLYLYVEDCDAMYAKAMAAGGKSLREPTTEFYGDRSSGVTDPWGNQWWIATHVEDVSPEEMMKRAEAAAAAK
jgi:PhnB protein